MTAQQGFEQHDLQWTREKSAIFWNHYAGSSSRMSTYFSLQYGDALLAYIRSVISLGAQVLDFGSGPGFLTEKLLDTGATCTALDFSEDSVQALRGRLGARANLAQVVRVDSLPSSLSDAAFDTCLLVETVEHLLEDDLDSTLTEASRLVRDGGHLVVTVPYREDLESHQVICADCGAVFHRMQHLTSWDEAAIGALLSRYGFDGVSIQGVNLGVTGWKRRVARILGRGGSPSHLVAIVRRRKRGE